MFRLCGIYQDDSIASAWYSDTYWCASGGGISIKHYSGVICSQGIVVGENCTIHHCVTIGRSFGGKNIGTPTIGNNVIIFLGAKIIGRVKIGDNVVIGANAVVLNDIPDNCIAAGIPAKIISNDSSKAIEEEHFRHYFGLE